MARKKQNISENIKAIPAAEPITGKARYILVIAVSTFPK